MIVALDYDGGTTDYNMLVRVTDGTYNLDIPVAVTVNPINDGNPTFASATHTISVNEDEAIDTILYQYAATDVDSSPHAIVTYEIITCKYYCNTILYLYIVYYFYYTFIICYTRI